LQKGKRKKVEKLQMKSTTPRAKKLGRLMEKNEQHNNDSMPLSRRKVTLVPYYTAHAAENRIEERESFSNDGAQLKPMVRLSLARMMDGCVSITRMLYAD
jgi:hypothetical protein